MGPDIMMVDLTANYLCDIESRTLKKRKANDEQTMLKDIIGPRKITILEIGYVADTKYEDKYKAKIHKSLCQMLEKEGHEVEF